MTTAWRQRMYLERKLLQICVHCRATLQDDDGVACVECSEAEKASKKRRRRKINKTKRRYMKRWRAQRKAASLCTRCPSSTDGTSMLCPKCRTKASEQQRRYKAMKRQGVIVLAKEATKRGRPKTKKPREPFYEPIDQKLERPRYRLLRAIRFMEWAQSSELMETLQVPSVSSDRRTHGIYSAMLSRLVRTGLVERRGEFPRQQHRLTDRGRAELEAAMRAA